MYDKGKIGAGIIIFLCLITIPIWYNVLAGSWSRIPDPKIVTIEKECIESTEYMKSEHMALIYSWRDRVVRDGERIYRASNGKTYDMSLTGTCLKCHSNKSEFCDVCHNYAGVTPYCWDCHIDTEKLRKESR
ncbi:MAG: hypothetical protein A2161_21860 [Candidatus Schekmanbacteria bacterium RBG_13_48_7]|uniref:Uncharacterized protein n=1 Tax=Candidatus Schekmanbacteria bacterium RBG_13_48_7 TaxID=1817878 RepID=A0A1F7RZ18_9BACT|nr:MAG: hypothetical protein A2161_21860 [Candidatus Schekmanbacteria bacterium RBG_13_48_7]